MNFFILLFTLAFSQPKPNPIPQELTFSQKFDHFNDSDSRTFSQRYLVYDKYYRDGGPIFFSAGGESDVYDGYTHNGLMFEMGEPLGALILFCEHRFYGKSLPFGIKESYEIDNLRKLTVEQAMSDFIVFLKFFRKTRNIPVDTPVVAWGGSYSGELVTFMRVAYPEDIHISLAGSAPLRYHSGVVKNGEYFRWVTNNFGREDSECPDLMRRAWKYITSLFNSGPVGRKHIQDKLRLCEPLSDDQSQLRTIALWAQTVYAFLSMLDYPWPSPYYKLPIHPLLVACNVLHHPQSPSNDELISNLASSIGIYYNTTGDLKCFNLTEEYYPCADITGCGGGTGDPNAMSWDYQSCTELVSNVDTNGITDMFPPAPYDFEAVKRYCMKRWKAVPDPDRLPTKYNYTTSSRIIFSNGLLDPWTPGGVLHSEGSLISILIGDGAHHLDMYGSDPAHDPSSVITARVAETEDITQWIKEVKLELSAKMLLR